ncbi:hypothetical protein Tco_0728551 [Tanacetum coccineum]|uniref:Retrotransposon gag domain-containing protein n=1 Tax=Tanacetum coccineum TaxID=301880 RepID=A0ABQ4YNW4_9ASTR
MAEVPVGEWLKFNNCNFSLDSRKEFRKRLTKIQIKEIELFRIKEQVVREYVMEFLSSFTFVDHIEALDEADTMVFQLGRGKEEYDHEAVHSGSWSVDTMGRKSDKAKGSKKKSPIVGAHLIGKIASYYGLMTLGALMNVTLGPKTSSMSVAKLVDLGICRYNGLGIGEMVAEIPEVVRDDDVGAGQAKIGGVGRHPNMSNANRLRAMDERLGEIVNDVDELLAHHHIDHTRYDGTHYSYVLSIPDLGVQQGVNFMSGIPGYSTAPSPSASQFGMFGDTHPSTSRNQDNMNDD